MKVSPVSGDLLVKAALVLGGVALAVWAARRAAAAATDAASAAWSNAADAVSNGAWAVTPWNNQNIVSQTVNGAIWPDGSDTLGTWLYGITHPEPRPENTGTNYAFYVPTGWDVTPQGPNGPRYNNPSAYIAPVGAMSIYR